MPLSESSKKFMRSLVSQYCHGKTDGVTDGVRTCKKARQVFYAYMNKHKKDYKLSEDELLDVAVDCVTETEEE